jgi:hypothetical protein
VLRLFKNQNPYTVILLFAVALLLKLPVLLHPALPAISENQGLWSLILAKIYQVFGTSAYLYTFFSIVNFALQGVFLNYIVNNFHLFPKRTYLPAYTYILINCLVPTWGTLDVSSINNWLLLILFNLILHTYSDVNTRKVLFNIGFVFGCLGLLHIPNFWYLFFMAFAIGTLRTYKPAEWMVTLLGLITPIYLLGGAAYLWDKMYLFSTIFNSPFSKNFSLAPSLTIALGVVAVCVAIGLIVLAKDMTRMLFQIKKMWWVGIILFTTSLVATVGVFQQGSGIWLAALIPATLFISKTWFVIKPKWLPELLHLCLFAAVIYLSFFL